MKHSFLVMVIGYWGRGATLQQAAQACLESGGRPTSDCVASIVIGDDKPSIDSRGFCEMDPGSERIVIGKFFKLGLLCKLTD